MRLGACRLAGGGSAAECRKLGFKDCLRKPYQLQALRSALDAVLG